MTNQRAAERRSRRAVLAAGVASAAAVVAAAVGRVAPVSAAADGEPVLLGQDQETTGATQIRRTDSGPVIVGNASGPGIGLSGTSQTGLGIQGTSEAGLGVVGSSKTGTGVEAASRDGIALHIRRGRFKIDRSSGQATIQPGKDEVSFGIPPGTFGNAFILMTPRSDLGGRDIWYTIEIAESTATIHISSPHESPVRVGWLLVG